MYGWIQYVMYRVCPVCVPAPPGVFLLGHGTRGRTKAHRRISQPTKPTNNTHPARQRDDRSRGRLNSRKPEADRSPRPTQKRPPPANPTLPPPAPRAPPRACSKAVGEMKARAADA